MANKRSQTRIRPEVATSVMPVSEVPTSWLLEARAASFPEVCKKCLDEISGAASWITLHEPEFTFYWRSRHRLPVSPLSAPNTPVSKLASVRKLKEPKFRFSWSLRYELRDYAIYDTTWKWTIASIGHVINGSNMGTQMRPRGKFGERRQVE